MTTLTKPEHATQDALWEQAEGETEVDAMRNYIAICKEHYADPFGEAMSVVTPAAKLGEVGDAPTRLRVDGATRAEVMQKVIEASVDLESVEVVEDDDDESVSVLVRNPAQVNAVHSAMQTLGMVIIEQDGREKVIPTVRTMSEVDRGVVRRIEQTRGSRNQISSVATPLRELHYLAGKLAPLTELKGYSKHGAAISTFVEEIKALEWNVSGVDARAAIKALSEVSQLSATTNRKLHPHMLHAKKLLERAKNTSKSTGGMYPRGANSERDFCAGLVLGESDLPFDTSGKLVGWIAMFGGKKLEIKKSEADGIYGAKQIAIKKLKVPKSKQGQLSINPAYESLDEAGLKKV
mgnify:CR=1 FL=1